MEKTLTKKQAQAIVMACRHWKEDIRMITDEDSKGRYKEWSDYLEGVSFTHKLPVNMYELYRAIDELCVSLTAKINKGDLK